MNTANTSPLRFLVVVGAAAALLAGSLLVASSGARADTASTTPPVITNPIATPSDTGATITWTTDQSATTQVLYGLTTSYDASSTLDSTLTTAHTSFLGGLLPNTLYHYQLLSGNASGTMATSSDATFMTASTTATTTPPVASTTMPVISNVVSTTTDTTATVTWTTNTLTNSQLQYGLTNSYGSLSTLDTSGVLSHSVMLVGLTPNTLYHFRAWSVDASSSVATSTDMTFTTLMTASTTTPPTTGSTTLDMLQSQIDALKLRVTALENFIANLGGGGGGTTTPPTGGTGTIDQNNSTINAGGSIDLTGRNFGHEETVTVTLNGATVATPHADGGGNFSTGGFAAPTTPGSYVYHFVGQNSGITANATVTVQ